jgi:hypothetical protein
MNKDIFNKSIRDIRKLGMTHREKHALLQRIHAAAHMTVPHKHTTHVKSPWSVFSFSTWVMERRVLVSVTAVIAIMVATGSGIAFAAQDALPGDALYGIKVHINEPIQVAFAGANRVKVQAELVSARLHEAEILALQGKLNSSNSSLIASLVQQQTSDFTVSLAQVNKDSHDTADAANVDFQAQVNAHTRLLNRIAVQVEASDTPEISNIVNIAKAGSQKLDQEIDGADIADQSNVHVVAARFAAPISTSTQPTAKVKKNNDAFKNRRHDVESLINTTVSDLNAAASTTVNVSAGATTSSFQQGVIQDTHTILDHAQTTLDAADQQDNNDNNDQAHSLLRDSEQSAKEASVLLNVGLNLSGDNNGNGNHGHGNGRKDR